VLVVRKGGGDKIVAGTLPEKIIGSWTYRYWRTGAMGRDWYGPEAKQPTAYTTIPPKFEKCWI